MKNEMDHPRKGWRIHSSILDSRMLFDVIAGCWRFVGRGMVSAINLRDACVLRCWGTRGDTYQIRMALSLGPKNASIILSSNHLMFDTFKYIKRAIFNNLMTN
jgi:hypothetical protein